MTSGLAPAILTPRSIGGLPLRKASDLGGKVNMIVYGEPGVGKTLLAGSSDAVPQMRNVLLLDIDGGALTLKDTHPEVTVLPVRHWNKLVDVLADLRQNADHGFQTVIIDTGTEAQKMNMAAIMKRVVQKAMEEKGEERDEDVPSLREWGITQEQVRRVIRGFRDLPLNFIMTCHVKDDRDEKTGITKKSPDLPGKLSRQVAAFFDVVLYMYVKEVDGAETRLVMSAASEKITAKDRTNKLSRVMKNPTMTTIYQSLTGVKQ